MSTSPEEELPQEEQPEEEDTSLRPVDSSMVAEVGWENGELEVVFLNGSVHTYPAEKEDFEDLLNAPSVGQWLWGNVDMSHAAH